MQHAVALVSALGAVCRRLRERNPHERQDSTMLTRRKFLFAAGASLAMPLMAAHEIRFVVASGTPLANPEKLDLAAMIFP
jgi:hypothetical protein